MMEFLAAGTILGLSAGLAPGPLLALLISETLQHDMKAGVRVAFAPIITDMPIIVLTLFVLAELSSFKTVLGIISLLGCCFILYLGYESIRTKGVSIDLRRLRPQSLKKGILVNALSPYPYLFWFSVGGPTTIKAMNEGISAAAGFMISFYALLVGSKIGLAVVVGRSRSFLNGKAYVYVMRILGFVLLILAGVLFHDGLKLLGILGTSTVLR